MPPLGAWCLRPECLKPTVTCQRGQFAHARWRAIPTAPSSSDEAPLDPFRANGAAVSASPIVVLPNARALAAIVAPCPPAGRAPLPNIYLGRVGKIGKFVICQRVRVA